MKHQKIALLAGAVTLILLVSACSQAVFQADSPAYPTFSLVGAPDRAVTYELRVTGPGMEPITRTGIGPTSGSLTLPVPAGRNRTFELLAENDVYSGFVTTTLAGGRENRVTVPMLPGPVFSDGTTLYQIRDLSANVQIVEGDVVAGPARDFELGANSRVAYASTGQLIAIEPDVDPYIVRVFDSLVDPIPLPAPTNLEHPGLGNGNIVTPDAVQFAGHDSDGDIVFVGVFVEESLVQPAVPIAAYLAVWSWELSGDPEFVAPVVLDITTAVPLSDDIVARAAVFDARGSMWVLIEDEFTEEFTMIRVRPEPLEVLGSYDIEIPGYSVPDYDGSTPPVVDMRAVGNSIVIVASAVETFAAPIFLFDTDSPETPLQSWGTKNPESEGTPGEFWGPRQFVATRRENELIIVDQRDFDVGMTPDPTLDGTARLVRFNFGTSDGWQTFGEGDFTFFDTGFSG